MQIFKTTILLTASLSVGLAATRARGAEATNAVVISTELINRLVAEARTNNPGLKAADSRVRSATLNAGAVRTWDDPMAMVGGSVFSSRGFDAAEEGDLAYGVEQKLPLWGRPKLTRRVVEAEASMRQAEVGYRAEPLRRDLAKALFTTAFAERVVEIGGQDLAWLQATATATENKYRAGQEREDQVLMAREELHHLAVGIEAMRREALLHRDEITTRAMQALTSRLSEWEAGRGAFRDVLDARRMLLESQLMSSRAIAEQHQMLAEMLLWAGLENLESLTPLATEPAILTNHDMEKTHHE